MRTKSLEKLTLYIFFLLYFFIGIYTLEDYGINIEEHTQLYSGFYWLNYVFEFFEIDFLKNNLKSFLNHIAQNNVSVYEVESNKQNLIKFYDEHNIFVLPSYTEGHPMVLLEALARRRPVILFEDIKKPPVTSVGASNKLANCL